MRDQLEYRAKQVAWVAAALTAFFIAIMAGDAAAAIYNQSSRVLRAVIFTLVALAGICMGLAYIRYQHAYRELDSEIRAGKFKEDDPSPNDEDWPDVADGLWYTSLGLTTLSPIAFLVAVWWATGLWCK
ncbi:hypothetical protein JIX56_19970 [Streptomyces sp. CA-210063]|uniref:hypothetical protein n=1 Tax=Streptomyces sp. CA-210063 TaxID=2801029 RepID=UPI00214C987C|nr:hypothetical protein [Streptomyces sp. CA-210063]UUU31998.1 hypothetical protein JIX56_19970 [Streptomyces sp. CA-210063]